MTETDKKDDGDPGNLQRMTGTAGRTERLEKLVTLAKEQGIGPKDRHRLEQLVEETYPFASPAMATEYARVVARNLTPKSS